MNQPSSKPTNLWPIGLIVFLGLFVLSMVGFVIYSGFQRWDLVSRDYYREELAYQQRIDAEQRALSLDESLVMNYDAGADNLKIKVPGTSGQAMVEGSVTFYRPSDARMDFKVPLSLASDGVQVLNTSKMKAGLWKVGILWRLRGQDYYVGQTLFIQ